MRARHVAAILASTLVIAACTSGARAPSTSTPPVPARATARTTLVPTAASPSATGIGTAYVGLSEHFYSPALLTVPVGTTVVWRVVGTQTHNVWAFDGSFKSPDMGPGGTYSYTFTKPGSHKYLCIPHSGDGMYGEVVVVERTGG
jgi:plastocyanin